MAKKDPVLGLFSFAAGAAFKGATIAAKAVANSAKKAQLESRYAQDVFGPIFPDPQEAKGFFSEMAKADSNEAALLRFLQVLRQSLYFAINSDSQKTAETNAALADKMMRKLENRETNIKISPQRLTAVRAEYNAQMGRFDSVMPLNVARRKLEDAAKLKTAKSAIKKIDETIAFLVDRRDNNLRTNPEKINAIIAKAEAKKRELLAQIPPAKAKSSDN
jgi:hypothetical protein